MSRFKMLDHPADARIRIHGATPGELFNEGLEGLYSLMEVPFGERKGATSMTLRAASYEELLVALLGEALFRATSHKTGLRTIGISVRPNKKERMLQGSFETYALGEAGREVKAVTFHRLRIRQRGGGWTASVIFDL